MTSLAVFSSPAGNWSLDNIPIGTWLSGCFEVGPTGILILAIFGEVFFFLFVFFFALCFLNVDLYSCPVTKFP